MDQMSVAYDIPVRLLIAYAFVRMSFQRDLPLMVNSASTFGRSRLLTPMPVGRSRTICTATGAHGSFAIQILYCPKTTGSQPLLNIRHCATESVQFASTASAPHSMESLQTWITSD